ncbi:MAG: archaellin/type IV pilin N-terminal domain-containing protein [Thermoplasmata archaeon]
MNILNKENGISEILSTLLILALTVILALALYLYASGLYTGVTSSKGTSSYLQMSVISEQNDQYVFIVESGSIPSPFYLYLESSSGQNLINSYGVVLTTTPVKISADKGKITVTIVDVNNDGKLDAGDVIIINYQNLGTSLYGYSFKIISGNIVSYSYTFTSNV